MEGLTAMPVGKRRSGIQLWIEDVLRPWFAGRILPIDEAAAERWGILAGQRSLQGRPLGVADGLIAATALQHDLTVVTRNVKDFDGLGVTIQPYQLRVGACREDRRGMSAAAERAVHDARRRQAARPPDQHAQHLVHEDGNVRAHFPAPSPTLRTE